MAGGGGGGGDLRAERAAEEARKAAARDAINKTFGIDPEMRTRTRTEILRQPSYQTFTTGGGTGSTQEQRSYVPGSARTVTEQVPAYDPTEATGNRAAREAGYTDLSKRVREYFMPDLQQDLERTNRNLNFALARNGLSGGSVEVDQRADVDRNYQKSLRDVEGRAITAGNAARSEDEATRLRLLNSVNAGLDSGSALAAAAEAQRNATNSAFDAAKGGIVGSVAENVALLNQGYQQGAARDRAMRAYNQLFSGPGSSTGGYSGTVVRG